MTEEIKIIKGAGGGPKPPPPPYRAPDTLHSRSFATIQDLISEGEIEGFASASKEGLTKGTTAYDNASLKDVFLDDTPVLDASAASADPDNTDFNFQDVGFKSKFGTSNQEAMSGIPNIDETRSPTSVAVTVTNADGTESGGITGSVTRQIDTPNIDAVIVTLTWPQIQHAEDDGDIRGDTVAYKIQLQHDNSGYQTKIESSVSGRTADAYARDHRIELTPGYSTVDIRVIRIDQDSTDSALVNSFQFTSFQEVIDNAQTYPNSAYVGLRLDSKQFNRIPTRKYRIRGIKVKIPGAGANNSGTPTVVTNQAQATALGLGTVSSFGFIHYPNGYIFNGTMGAAVWTSCPAMCLLDLLTNTRYGFGDHITDSNIDLFSFVAASKYSNELVDDGDGDKEPRFSCNVNIQSPKEAFDAINELAGVMRCMPIWSAGSITISQDKPLSASYLFNLSNVSEDGFSYSGSSLKQRHSIFSVSYFNMDSKEVDFEVVGDSDSAADVLRRQKLGTAIKKVKAFACTSRNQAARLGRAMMFTEEQQSEVVSFNTSIDAGVVVRPGAVIEINDPVRAGARRGGRVVAATTTTITIDSVANTTLSNLSNSPTISVVLADGTVETGTISSFFGAVITVDSVTKQDGSTQSTFTTAPNVNSPYLISSNELQTQLFRVISVEEKDGINYQISAITYIEGKYNFIENNIALPTRTISILNALTPPPSNLGVQEKIVTINSIARSKLIIDWKPLDGVTQYLVNYKFEDTNFISQIVFSSDFEILDSKRGTYTIQVFSFNSSLQISKNATTVTFVAEGKTALPENVSSLTVEPINEQFVRLRFTQATALDVLHGGRVYIRHTNQIGGGATFQAAQDIIEAVPGNSTEVICPALPGTYLAKFQDDGLRFSEAAASVSITLPNILDSITVKSDREDTDTPPFNNTTSSLFTNTQYNSTRGGLILTNPSAVISGTYSQATNSTTITCTISSHGLSQGEFLNFRFTTGDAVNGKFIITSVTNANVFVITAQKSLAPELIHTGNVSVDRGLRGTYDFNDTLDLGAVFSLTLKRHFQGAGFFPSALWDDRVGLVDSFVDWDGDAADSANAKLAVRTSTDMSSYTDFNDFANGTFKGRGFQFRATLETSDAAQNMLVQELGYSAEMPSRTEQSAVIASGSGAKTVTFTHPFFVGTSALGNLNNFLPSVVVSPQNMSTGDYFELTNITGTGFTVHFKNSSDASINRNFTYSAAGFGKGG